MLSSGKSTGDLIYQAKLAEQAERYPEMVEFMKELARDKQQILTVEERNLFSVAYKNVVALHRASWRIVRANEKHQLSKQKECQEKRSVERLNHHKNLENIARHYRLKIEKDLTGCCKELVTLLNDFLIPVASPTLARWIPEIIHQANSFNDKDYSSMEKYLASQLTELETKHHALTSSNNGQTLVFYYKMMGDYHRYMAEFKVDGEEYHEESSLLSLGAFYVASEIAKTQLSPTDPIRLSLALNFSVFYYEIMSQPDQACHLAKNAFDEAIAEIDQLTESSYKDASMIMQMLRDNFTKWTQEINAPEDDPDADG